MALTISIGFVVDDAIVMIENIHRNLEAGMGRLQAAIVGARQISFTIISISLSLIAAFIPLLFMDGIIGKFLQEFSYTLAFAIFFSTLVSLTLTPMICGHFMKRDEPAREGRFGRAVEAALGAMIAFYGRTLTIGLRHVWVMLVVMLLTVVLTIQMYRSAPKGSIPQDDTGLIFGFTEASPDISFLAMAVLQQQAEEIVLADDAVAGTASSIGPSQFGGTVNQGRLFISLEAARRTQAGYRRRQVIDRLRARPVRPDRGAAGLFMFAGPGSRHAGGAVRAGRNISSRCGARTLPRSCTPTVPSRCSKRVKQVAGFRRRHDRPRAGRIRGEAFGGDRPRRSGSAARRRAFRISTVP